VDEFVIMPNHVHGIIRIVKENGAKNSRAAFLRPVHNAGAMVGAAEMRPSSTVNRSKMLLSHAVHSFKSAVTANICKLSESDFQWQRSFYDHIIRDEEELFRVREYIINNPLMWSIDHGKYD
jgi:REP element-mobilizing transposase RayT